MATDYNLNKMAKFFKFFLRILEKLQKKKRIHSFSSLGKRDNIFLPVL